MFDKDGVLQAIQHALKYRNRPRYGVPLGHLMGEAFREANASPDGVVPVPLHQTRRLERGYNQSATLAEGAAEALECPCRPELLARPHPTRSQTGLSRGERWRNVRDAFRAEPACAGGHWLLVDDVLTTGATATAAGQVLLDAGAERLSLMTLGLARQ
ncbi:MAG: ComF family protein [Salinibacter sp.]